MFIFYLYKLYEELVHEFCWLYYLSLCCDSPMLMDSIQSLCCDSSILMDSSQTQELMKEFIINPHN